MHARGMKPGGGLLREIADEAVVKAVTLRKITDKAGVEAMPVAQGLGVKGETSLDAGAAVIGVVEGYGSCRHEDPKFRGPRESVRQSLPARFLE